MEKARIDRINELAHLAKTRELTPEELSERDALRKEYIAEWRRGAEQVLENTYLVTPDGKKHRLFIGPEKYPADICSVISAQAFFGNRHIVLDLELQQKLHIREIDSLGKIKNGFCFHKGPVCEIPV